MTVSINLANVADAISQMSISGVTVKDKDQIVGSWLPVPNVFFPQPDRWITNFKLEYATVMQGATAAIDISYTLNYRFLGTQLGDIGTFPVAYSNLVDKLILILNAAIAVPAPYSGRVELKVSGVDIGPLPDPAGNMYFGADVSFDIMEMQN